MQKKQIKLELDGNWVLAHREADKLPITAFIELVSKAFAGSVEVSDASLTECTFFINECDIDDDCLSGKINSILREDMAITDSDNVAKITINDIDISETTTEMEVTTEAQSTGKAEEKTDIGDMIRGFSAAISTIETDGKSTDEQIKSLIGADEFKELADEIRSIAPHIIEHKTYDAFSFQSYLFSINDGCGMSTYLNLLASLIEENKLFKFNSKQKVVEEKLLPPGSDKYDPFAPVMSHLQGFGKNGGKLISIDISEWMTHTGEKTFRNFLSYLEDHSAENIIVFRIPFVEGDVLEDIGESLQDIMFIRTVAFPPMDMEELTKCAKRFLGKLGFSADDGAWTIFNARMMEEKSDGRFYGMNTVNKIVREMVYRKQLCDAKNGTDDTIIKDKDIKSLSKSFSKSMVTAESMLIEMVGMERIKDSIDEIVSQIELSRKNKNISAPSIHMRFVGSPGTGKTTVARIIGLMLKERGVLRNGNFFEYSGRDFCGRYVGETAPKTAAMCRDAYGSVLFIDEAYSLYRGDDSGRDYGREALETLIAEMENHRNDLVVIMAGYTDEMTELMKGNAGLESRMPYVIEFPNYTREQLSTIFFKMIGDAFTYDDEFKTAVCDYFNSITDEVIAAKNFSNARFVRNLFERTCAKASMRKNYSDEGKLILSKDDFKLASSERAFQSLITRKAKIRIGF